VNISECCAPEPQSRGHIGKAAVHKHHVGGVYCNVGTCAYRNADIGGCKSGCVIYSVANHCNLAVFFKLSYNGLFAVRQNVRNNRVNAYFVADCLCGARVVARKHNNVYAHLFKLRNRVSAVGLYNVCNSNNAKRL